MLEFVIFAATSIVLLISLVIYLYPGSRKQTSVPGLDLSHPKEGNIADIFRCESFHEFLINLHSKFGSVASFWLYGPSLAISVSSAKLIQSQNHLFEKPSHLFKIFEPFVGPKSILFAEKNDARRQRSVWDTIFQQSSCNAMRECISKLIDELINKWSSLPKEQHIPVGQYMKSFALKLCLNVGFGNYFSKNHSAIIDFSRCFEICWKELEARSCGDLPEKDSPRIEHFKNAIHNMRELIKKSIESKDKSNALLDPLIYNEQLSDETVLCELMTYVLKHYSISSALSWSIYYIASDEHLQENLNQKIIDKDFELIDNVVNAIFLTANVEQWTARINNDVDTEINGHVIPKETPIIQSLSFHHDNECQNSTELFKKFIESNDTNSMAFGIKGSKRSCPAEYYSIFLVKAFIIKIITRFKLKLVDPDIVPRPVYRLISRAEEEFWITVTMRD